MLQTLCCGQMAVESLLPISLKKRSEACHTRERMVFGLQSTRPSRAATSVVCYSGKSDGSTEEARAVHWLHGDCDEANSIMHCLS